jgi:hypothetical protein
MALCEEWVSGVGVRVLGGLWGDPMASCDGMSRFMLIIQAYSRSEVFFERSREILSRAHCFSCSS